MAASVRTIYQQLSPEEVHAQADRVVAQVRDHFPQAAEMLEDTIPHIPAFTASRLPDCQKVWSNNPLERLNKEIRRRTDLASIFMVGIFPDPLEIWRLVGAVLAEQHDEWAEARHYLTVTNDLDTEPLTAPNVLEDAA